MKGGTQKMGTFRGGLGGTVGITDITKMEMVEMIGGVATKKITGMEGHGVVSLGGLG